MYYPEPPIKYNLKHVKSGEMTALKTLPAQDCDTKMDALYTDRSEKFGEILIKSGTIT